MRILWNGAYLDAHLTIGTEDESCLHLKYAIQNSFDTLVGVVDFDIVHGKPMPTVEIIMRQAIEVISEIYMQQEVNRKAAYLNHGHALQ